MLRNFNHNRSDEGGVSLQVITWLFAAILLGGSIYGTYTWQHRKVESLNQQTVQLNKLLTAAKQNQTSATTHSFVSKRGVISTVYIPASNDRITSPVIVMGQVPGSWSFEASFPVKLLDANGNVVAEAPAEMLGDWMTDKLVPFSVKLSFTSAQSGKGTLVLHKDNPSGLAENDDIIIIPIKF